MLLDLVVVVVADSFAALLTVGGASMHKQHKTLTQDRLSVLHAECVACMRGCGCVGVHVCCMRVHAVIAPNLNLPNSWVSALCLLANT